MEFPRWEVGETPLHNDNNNIILSNTLKNMGNGQPPVSSTVREVTLGV